MTCRQNTRRSIRRLLSVVVVMMLGVPLAGPVGLTQASGTSSVTYTYTGAEQTFTVPAGVNTLHIAAIGAGGYTVGHPSPSIQGGNGGYGASVSADIPVPAGLTTLFVEVGGNGKYGTSTQADGGGFNGGGNGANGGGGGGGGASDIRACSRTATSCSMCPGGAVPCTTLASRLVVAAGGGGGGMGFISEGHQVDGIGGNGGDAGNPGQNGQSAGVTTAGAGGSAATSSSGGAGGSGGSGSCLGTAGTAGALAAGGTGGLVYCNGSAGGGGGGGGYYGGGGGGGGGGDPGSTDDASGGGGGGGGSSYLETAAANASIAVATTTAPSITISYTISPTASYLSHLSMHRHGRLVVLNWTLTMTKGVLGFDVFARERHLNSHLIPVHAARAYSYRGRHPGHGPFSLRICLLDGHVLALPLR